MSRRSARAAGGDLDRGVSEGVRPGSAAVLPDGHRPGEPAGRVRRGRLLRPEQFRTVECAGQFVNRTVTFAKRYFDGRVPDAGERSAADEEQLALCKRQAEKAGELLELFPVQSGAGRSDALAREGNRYFDAKQPWKQRKEDLAACGTTINVCLQTVKALATIMAPFPAVFVGQVRGDAVSGGRGASVG